jgi:uncharacterized Tic20 family protein
MTEPNDNPPPPPPPTDAPPAQPPPYTAPPADAPSQPAPLSYGYSGAPRYQGPEPSPDERTMGMLAHLLGIVTGFIGPLIVWLIKKDTSPFVDDQGKEALNFQLTLLIGYAISFVLMFVCIGYFTALGLWVASIVFGIIASVAAYKGETYRYPFNIRMIT